MVSNQLVVVQMLVPVALAYDMSSGFDSLLYKLSASMELTTFVEILQVVMISSPSGHQPQFSQ